MKYNAPPKVFISYAWESNDHSKWVKNFASQLRQDGIEAILDQWMLVPGDQLPNFMEQSIRDSDYVLIICTPKYKEKSDGRKGGVGYEGDIMSSEVTTGVDRRKFIPILRNGSWNSSSPSWLRGSYYVDLREGHTEIVYRDLVDTISGLREKAPPVQFTNPKKNRKNTNSNMSGILNPLEMYMQARVWLAQQNSKYPIAVEPSKVGWYNALSKSGGGYFYDEVLEYRVWVHPLAEGPMLTDGNDYFCAFPSYEEALKFSIEMPGSEEPLALVLQREHLNEVMPGKFEHIIGDRITEWRVEWLLKKTKRNKNSIINFLKKNQKEY